MADILKAGSQPTAEEDARGREWHRIKKCSRCHTEAKYYLGDLEYLDEGYGFRCAHCNWAMRNWWTPGWVKRYHMARWHQRCQHCKKGQNEHAEGKKCLFGETLYAGRFNY